MLIGKYYFLKYYMALIGNWRLYVRIWQFLMSLLVRIFNFLLFLEHFVLICKFLTFIPCFDIVSKVRWPYERIHLLYKAHKVIPGVRKGTPYPSSWIYYQLLCYFQLVYLTRIVFFLFFCCRRLGKQFQHLVPL